MIFEELRVSGSGAFLQEAQRDMVRGITYWTLSGLCSAWRETRSQVLAQNGQLGHFQSGIEAADGSLNRLLTEMLPESITKDNSALEFGALGNYPCVRPWQGNEENGGLVALEVMGCTSKHDVLETWKEVKVFTWQRWNHFRYAEVWGMLLGVWIKDKKSSFLCQAHQGTGEPGHPGGSFLVSACT